MGVYPFYPRGWRTTVAEVPDPRLVAGLGAVEHLLESRRHWAGHFHRIPFRFSVFLGVFWETRDRWFAAKIAEKQTALLSLDDDATQERAAYRLTGPAYRARRSRSVYDDLAEVWMNSSLHMHRLCTASDILYWHFLQPNQYVRGSRRLTPSERAMAFNPQHPYKPHAEQGYPYLRHLGRHLAYAGSGSTT